MSPNSLWRANIGSLTYEQGKSQVSERWSNEVDSDSGVSPHSEGRRRKGQCWSSFPQSRVDEEPV